MTVADFITDTLIKKGTTDAFGIPGGVVLNLIYALDKRKEELCPHLSYHEQCAGFAACGYAQASGKLGVAYATRGPGFTNMITPIADAYYDSLPVLFITAHADTCPPKEMRIMADQEMDTCEIVKSITKKAVRLDSLNTFAKDFVSLCDLALEGRKGPVFLDVSSQLLSKELPESEMNVVISEPAPDNDHIIKDIEESIRKASRPVLLVGDGVNQVGIKAKTKELIKKIGIPVLSSRFSHDVDCGSDLYFGYVGSHGIRCANFILSKTDLIVTIGNRLHFPPKSESFSSIFEHARIIRCDIDEGEFSRSIPNSTAYKTDLTSLIPELIDARLDFGKHDRWLETCNLIRKELNETDVNEAVSSISSILSSVPSDYTIVNDVGNNEFWVSRASVYVGLVNRVLYSKSLGALGSGLAKAIGTYYATRKPVLCFVGDQGLQMNIQELQFVSQHNVPIVIVVINNGTSGMIKDKEVKRDHFLHTTKESGFLSPCINKVAEAYNLSFVEYKNSAKEIFNLSKPLLVNVAISDDLALNPNLPKGFKCQDLQPSLEKELFNYINQL